MTQEPIKRATEAPDFVIDEDRSALLNTNRRGLQAYRQQRAQLRKNAGLHTRIEELERSLNEIRALLVLNRTSTNGN